MFRTFLIAAFLTAGALHGAIKKDPNSKPATPPPAAPPAAKPPEAKPEKKEEPKDPLAELLKRAQKEGGTLKMDVNELMSLLRQTLEKQGVPADELKNAPLPELLRLMKEKNPDSLKGLGLGRPPGFDKSTEKKLTEHFLQLLEGHKPGSLKAAAATFSLRDGKKPAEPLAFATCVNRDGWLLTKASEVSGAGELQVEIKGAWLAAKVVRSWQEHDLALIKVTAKDMPVVTWAGSEAPQVGTFITATAPEGRDPVALGVVSVLPRSLITKGQGFLGVTLASDERGLKVSDLSSNGPAKASGLQKEDRILELDGKKPDSIFTFTKMISDRKAGEKVKLKLQRGEAVVEKEIALGDRGSVAGPRRSGNDKMNAISGTMSKRRTDFPSVMQTDLPLQAAQCGGPVTDLDGNVVGLVIARSGRIETLVLPGKTLRGVLDGVDFSKEEANAAAKAVEAKPAAPVPSPKK